MISVRRAAIFPPHPQLQKTPATKSIISNLLRSRPRSNHLKQIHAIILTSGLSIKNSLLTQILESLCNSGDMPYARTLFDEMHKPRPFLYNTLARGYLRIGLHSHALQIYRAMRRLGRPPDSHTFPFALRACAALLDIAAGAEAHAAVIKFGVAANRIVCTELLLMYAKFGNSDYADSVFESMGEEGRDLVSWNAIIAAYSQTGRADKALEYFRRMEFAGIKPDTITLACVLSACAYLGCFELGKKIHGNITDGISSNIFVDNALLDMYSKCGNMENARKLFDEMPSRNVVSWTAIIGGYAINGDSQTALNLYSQMLVEGLRPNNVTILNALSACGHAGLVEQGKHLFRTITPQPTLEHCAAMVDLLGRSGYLQEAYSFIHSMPMDPDAAIWGALLNACAINRDINLGEIAADKLQELAPKTPSYQILLSNMYAGLGRWGDVEKVRDSIQRIGVKKIGGFSSIELDNGEVHLFYEGSGIGSEKMKRLLSELVAAARGVGYGAGSGTAMHDVEEEEKEEALMSHSERIAVAFGLMRCGNAGDLPLRVMKNLRVCWDCHEFCKFVTVVVGREILMRDKSRFHRFREGKCSCGDFW